MCGAIDSLPLALLRAAIMRCRQGNTNVFIPILLLFVVQARPQQRIRARGVPAPAVH